MSNFKDINWTIIIDGENLKEMKEIDLNADVRKELENWKKSCKLFEDINKDLIAENKKLKSIIEAIKTIIDFSD